jgi:hypothetical protein
MSVHLRAVAAIACPAHSQTRAEPLPVGNSVRDPFFPFRANYNAFSGCGVGRYRLETGKTVCGLCDPGRAQPLTTQSECPLCAVPSYLRRFFLTDQWCALFSV